MAIWEKATLTATTPSARINVDAGGTSWVKILSAKFRLNDGVDYTYLGFGNRVIQ